MKNYKIHCLIIISMVFNPLHAFVALAYPPLLAESDVTMRSAMSEWVHRIRKLALLIFTQEAKMSIAMEYAVH